MYWDYWEEKGGNIPGWETQESAAEGKGRMLMKLLPGISQVQMPTGALA